MNKSMIPLGVMVGSTIGTLLPQRGGDRDFLGLAWILLGLVGGFVGVGAGVRLGKLSS